jgi:serine/threonine protein kinase/tetratricopeptide (TPR) repeat protein
MTERTLFEEALARPAAERAAFLEEACAGQPNLRAAVEALLASHDEASSFLELPLVDLAQAVDSDPGEARPCATGEYVPEPDATSLYRTRTRACRPPTEPGAIVAGRYTLEQRLGEGGMGEVWVARQTEPVKRRVALKLVKTGMDSKAVLARFEQERQALALMDHPNIARVLDGGMTASGQPFFVMELVNGLPLTKFCDEAKLTPKQRLELFVPICQAVQHAHQKGIVHRDLKPSNILVTLYDGQPVPKVIDFGVAKATGGKLTDESVSTQFGAVIGTVEYMAPEQAGFSALDVDTRADIYSLGVLLYELLTGLKPFDGKRLRRAALDDLFRILREEEPSRPSTRLSTDASLPTVAALRQTEPNKLMALMRGELDWIVMKCLEKQRDRRYETASGLARDIQRYLADEAVEARPPSTGYRLGKFLRRHRKSVLAAAAVAAALVLGTVVAVSQAIRATRAEAAARAEAEAKEKARWTAEANFTLARESVTQYLARVAKDRRLKEKDFFDLRKSLLETAVPFYHKLAAAKSGDPLHEAARGQAYMDLALLRDEMGEKEAARSDFENARAVFERLVADFPTESRYRHYLASSCNNVGAMLKALGKHAEAETAFRQALAVAEQLAAEFPRAAPYRQTLGNSYNSLGTLSEALGKPAEAEAAFRQALAIWTKLFDESPTLPQNRRNLARSHHNLGWLLMALGKHAEAETAFRQALAIRAKLAADSPGVAECREELGITHTNLGRLLAAVVKPAEAETAFREALALQEKLAAEFPSVPQFRHGLGNSQSSLGKVLLAQRRLPQAEMAFRQDLAIREKLVADFPSVTEYHLALAISHQGLSAVLEELGKHVEAEAALRRSLDIAKRLTDDFPSVPAYREKLARCHTTLGWLLKDRGKYAEAETALRQALAIQEKLVADFPDLPSHALQLGGTYSNFGHLVRDRGEPANALEWFARAIARMQPVLQQEPRLATARLYFRNAHWGRAEALGQLGRHAEAIPDWERASACNDEGHRDAWFRLQRASALARAGQQTGATAAVEALLGPSQADASTLYGAACVHALTAGVAKGDQAQAEKHAARAVGLLRQAVQAGYTDLAQLKKAADLDALRQRQDFQALLGDLEKANATSKPK